MTTREGYTIVCLPPQERPVYFVVPLVHPETEISDYMVSEGSCPTNWLRDIQRIICDGDTDPHGLFEYVRDIPEQPFIGHTHNPDDEWPKVVPEAFPELPQTVAATTPLAR
jgi:hypothetical protein